MTAQDSAQVISGVPYEVAEVAGQSPHSLSDFIGTVEFTVSRQEQLCHISGVGADCDGRVRFNEKAGGTGKDVRIWYITHLEDDGRFHAEVASNF